MHDDRPSGAVSPIAFPQPETHPAIPIRDVKLPSFDQDVKLPSFDEVTKSNVFEQNFNSVNFGDIEFNLPTDGSFPDRPLDENLDRDLSAVFRDLPGVAYDPKVPDLENPEPENLAKPYLENPFGSDFVRLEVDPDRYTHNKTFGIRHVPLMVKGHPVTVGPNKKPGVFKQSNVPRRKKSPMELLKKGLSIANFQV